MRLIDADALKEVFKEVYPLATNEMGCIVNKRIYDIIENAPTVDFYKCRKYMEVQTIKSRINFDRLKGKWKSVDAFVVKCSICGVESFATPFCPRCGADMRGDEE